MSKFWNKSNNSSEIFIYGDIVGEKFFDTDVTAKSFVEDLRSFGENDVTIHINSNGGDCFTALAIANTIKSSANKIKISIDGVCASAATLIACAGDSVSMAKNALMMTHSASVGLCGFYDERDIDSVKQSLDAVKHSILQTYADRLNKTIDEINTMLDDETWYTADEAKAAGFIDEIVGEVEIKFDDMNKTVFLNSLAVKGGNYAQLKSKLEVRPVDNQNLIDKIKNILAGAKNDEVKNQSAVEEVRTQELARIRNLNALKCDNAAVNAIIDCAITDGKSAENIQKYIDAVKNVSRETVQNSDNTAKAIFNLIQDNLKSGAEGVFAEAKYTESMQDKSKIQADMIAKFANSKI